MEDKKEILDEQLDKDLEQTDKDKEDTKQDEPETDKEQKTFTQEEVEKMITQRLAREKKKLMSEAEKLASMTEKEREEMKRKKELEEFENERKAFEREKLELQASKILSKEGLPAEFASLILADDAEGTKANIDTFKKTFQDAVEKAVNEKLKGGYTPKKSDGKTPAITVEAFRNMGYAERVKLLTEQPELYSELEAKAKKR